MKHTRNLKSILTMVLAVCIMFTGITAVNTEAAYAASKKTPFTITLNNKTATLAKDVNKAMKNGIKDGDNSKKYVKKLSKKWGKYTHYEDVIDGFGSGPGAICIWEKGKSTTAYSKGVLDDCVRFDLYSKKDAFCGIKPGMKKSAVTKKLKKIVNANYIHENIDISNIDFMEVMKNADSVTNIGWYDTKQFDNLETAYGGDNGILCVNFVFKNGKLIHIGGRAQIH